MQFIAQLFLDFSFPLVPWVKDTSMFVHRDVQTRNPSGNPCGGFSTPVILSRCLQWDEKLSADVSDLLMKKKTALFFLTRSLKIKL